MRELNRKLFFFPSYLFFPFSTGAISKFHFISHTFPTYSRVFLYFPSSSLCLNFYAFEMRFVHFEPAPQHCACAQKMVFFSCAILTSTSLAP